LLVERDHSPFGLADDLARDHDDVALLDVGRQEGSEIVTGGDLADALDRKDPDHGRPRSNVACAIAAVASTSVIIRGTARQAIPAASTAATAPASTVSTSQPSST